MKKTLKKNYRSLRKTDDFYRAEIRLNKNDISYLVKLRKLNGNEVCFFIKQDSSIFNMFEAGNVLEMKIWTIGTTKTVKYIRAKVKNIKKENREFLNGHYLGHIYSWFRELGHLNVAVSPTYQRF